ncbi:MAG: leucyl/phenylalanyl-tRNA--protein transferase, partial [Candidatus Riflebacteria bacterium]
MAKISFPNPELADSDGLLAIGGNLEPETLVAAYTSGVFPWTVRPITWWSPNPRAVFNIESFRLSSRMERMYRSGRFEFSIDQDFSAVINGCAKSTPGRESTWISPQFIAAYERLHELGIAHSCEVWKDDRLAGGVYGVAIGGFFAGESMFYEVSNASNLCLRFLMSQLAQSGFALFDSQVITPHTRKLGAVEISRPEYLERLKAALKKH